MMIKYLGIKFQSTLPCGSDSNKFTLQFKFTDFNPRSLAGATFREAFQIQRWYISIHAPLRERLLLIILPLNNLIFQSTLPCGSDFLVLWTISKRGISIHAPLRERLLVKLMSRLKKLFQSTLPCGSDSMHKDIDGMAERFQSTLPCGSDH